MKTIESIKHLGAVFFDIDGTLVTDNGSLLPSTIEAIKILKSHSIPVCLASGRASFGAYHLIDALSIVDPCMFHSGAVIINPTSKQPLMSKPLLPSEVRQIINRCHELKLYLELYTHDGYYIETPTWVTDVHTSVLKVPPIIESFEAIENSLTLVKAVAVATHIAEHATINALKTELPSLQFGVAPGSDVKELLFANITNASASRADAFDWFASKYYLSNAASLSFGDATSDIPFFHRSTMGVAMKNAPIEVQNQAGLITDSNEDHGIWNAFHAIFPKEFSHRWKS